MSRVFTLTDADRGIELSHWEISHRDMDLGTIQPFRVRKRTLAGGRQTGSTLVEIEVDGLSITVVPTRGMALRRATANGIELGWTSPVNEVVHPAFIHAEERGGLGWLDGFGDLMVRCGYEWTGHPGVEDGRTYSLHGRAALTPASKVIVEIEEAPPHRIHLRGLLREKTFKFVDFEIWTDLIVTPGRSGFTVADELRNLSDYDHDHQIIYHINFGPPLLGEGSRFVAPLARVAPFNARAKEGLSTWETYLGPTRGFDEEVFVCEPAADDAGIATAALIAPSGDFGVVERFDIDTLPFLTLWKNTDTPRQGYVTGLEPGTNPPHFVGLERRAGRVHSVPAGKSVSFKVDVDLLRTRAEVERIEELARNRRPVVESEPVFAAF